jgi:plastocyanin domain-containing protein
MPFSLIYGQETKEEAKPEVKPETKQEAPEQKGKIKRIVATVDPDGVQRVEITGGEYYFDPNYIVVKVNVPVELKVKKAAGYVPHNLMVKAPEAGIDFKTDLSSKEVHIVKFTPTKVGKYPMYCDKRLLFFKSHRDRGMEGTIEVVE